MNIINKKLGYTLMEMMITVVVISLLAAAGVPYYRDHVERQKLALGITNLRMIADSVERYMALHNDNIPDDFKKLDAGIDSNKLYDNNRAYNDGNFVFRILGTANPPKVSGRRHTGGYIISFSLDDNSELSCEPVDFCCNKFALSCPDTQG